MVNCRSIAETLFSYETPKIVQIRSLLVGIIGRLIQIIIIAYIIGYAIVYKKGYQEFSDVESSVTTKVKGVVFTNFSDDAFNDNISHPEWYRRIWDVADYVVPPSENGATFIATNIIITENQTQETCAEDYNIEEARCDPDNNTCMADKSILTGNGAMTGRCIKAKGDIYSCEVKAWCPIEEDFFPLKNSTALLEASQDFTILIKNFVDFPKFSNSSRRNIRDTSNSSYLKNCRYDPHENQDCPVFRLGDIVRWSGHKDYNAIAFKGGVIAVVIKWDCNFDFDKKYCFPKYEFSRLDDPEAKLAPGWNFRYANYFSDSRRTLYKMYGIRLSISVVGQAGQFRIVPLLTNVGAGLGLLALEVVICDIVVLYLVKKRVYFKSKKYEEVDPEDDEEWTPIAPEICVVKPEIPILQNNLSGSTGSTAVSPEICVVKQEISSSQHESPKRDLGDGYERLED